MGLSMQDYQKAAERTAVTDMDNKTMHLAWSLAIAGEAGELANQTKKVFIHGHPYEKEKLIEELGDILWYIAVYAQGIGSNLEEVATENIKKLDKRYPNGFSTSESINRKL